MNNRFEHQDIPTNGIRLHVITAGPEDASPVILLHGFPEFWYGWRHQIPALAEAGYRVLAPDQRGYNLSDKPKGIKAYRMEALVGDVLGLLEALDYENVTLIGHDWGAAVAWTFALMHPERLNKLGILNVPHPAVMFRFLRSDLEQLRRSWYIFFFQLPWLPEYLMRQDGWRGGARLLRGSGKLHTFTNQDMTAYKKAWAQPGAITGMVNWYRAILRYPPKMPKDLSVRVPTLILWGKKDVALSHRMAQPSVDYCDPGELIFFEKATHWVQHDEREAVTQHLLRFLKR